MLFLKDSKDSKDSNDFLKDLDDFYVMILDLYTKDLKTYNYFLYFYAPDNAMFI